MGEAGTFSSCSSIARLAHGIGVGQSKWWDTEKSPVVRARASRGKSSLHDAVVVEAPRRAPNRDDLIVAGGIPVGLARSTSAAVCVGVQNTVLPSSAGTLVSVEWDTRFGGRSVHRDGLAGVQGRCSSSREPPSQVIGATSMVTGYFAYTRRSTGLDEQGAWVVLEHGIEETTARARPRTAFPRLCIFCGAPPVEGEIE